MFAFHLNFDTLAPKSFIPYLYIFVIPAGWLGGRSGALLSTRTRADSLLILR